MILVLSIGSISYVLFEFAEKSIVSNAIGEMKYLTTLKTNGLDTLHKRASEDILFAVKNPAFENYFGLPESRNLTYNSEGVLQFTERQRVLKNELEQWIYNFQSKFPVDETCLIHSTGQEHARLVLGGVAPDDTLSSEEARTPFFTPTFELEKDQVHIEKPYVSPDTHRWVFAYATPIVLPDGSKPAIFHFEMPMKVYQDVVNVEKGRMYVLDPEGYLVADSETDFQSKIVLSENPEEYFPSVTAISTSNSFTSMLDKMSTAPEGEPSSSSYIDEQGETRYVVYEQLPSFGWRLVYEVPYSQLLAGDSSLGDLRSLTATMAAAIGALGLFIAYFVSDKVTLAIKHIADQCKNQKPGQSEIIKSQTNDELTHVVDAINNMVTRIRDNESKIIAANDELTKLDKMKTEFLSVASHELKTPIQPIMSYAELGKSGRVKPEIAFDEIKKNSLRLGKLANDILDVSRIEGGRLNLAKEYIKVNDMISDFVNTSRVSLNNDISIELRMTAPDNLSVLADRARLNQVLFNIVGNAVKFTKQGIIMVETNVVEFGKQVEITITDNGPGIHKDILPKLFDKFASRNGHNSGNEGGTGLGLYLSKAIIEAHGGSVSASNNKAKGARFEIILPTCQALDQDEGNEAKSFKNSLLGNNSLIQVE